MIKKILTILFFILVAAGVYYFIEEPSSNKHIITIRRASLEVEVAHNDYLRKAGLMGRSHLDPHKAMLFIFKEPAIQGFWMKNTLVPLSIAFIKEDRKISQIMDMSPDRWDKNLTTYYSQEKVKYALEVNQGWFEKNGIKIEDKVHFSRSIRKISVE